MQKTRISNWIRIASVLATVAGTSPAAEFEFCVTTRAAGTFELWVAGTAASDHSGVAGFSVVVNGTVSSFDFDPIFIGLPGLPAMTAGFDERGEGTLGGQYHIYGAQTAIAPNSALYDLAVISQLILSDTGPIEFGAPLRIGTGTYTGTPPSIDASSSACNAFAPARDSSTLAAAFAVGGCPCQGDLDGDGDIDIADLSRLLSNFGTPSGASADDGDLDGDGDVDITDLASLLARFGTLC